MKVRELRDKLNMSRMEFAWHIKCSVQSIGNWERENLDVDDHYIHMVFREKLEKLAKKAA